MSSTMEDQRTLGDDSGRGIAAPGASPVRDATDTPIPLWPEGVIALCAGLALLMIAVRHRVYLQRKVAQGQRMADEFQRQGGMEEVQQVARQAMELLRGSG